MGDLRGFVANTTQQQLQIDDLTITETNEFEIDNEIIRSNNGEILTIKKVWKTNKYFLLL